MKSITQLLLLVLLTCKALAQADSAVNPYHCFPSGSSLFRAFVSSDFKTVSFTNVKFIIKFFDLKTLDLLRTFDPTIPGGVTIFYNASEENFKLVRKNRDFQTGHPQNYQVIDKNNKVVTDYDQDKMNEEYFDPISGCLLLSDAFHKNSYLLRPGEKSLKLIKNCFGHFGAAPFYDRNHKYMVFPSGTIVNMETGKYRKNEFLPFINYQSFNVSKIAFSEDGQNYIVNVASGGMEVHNIETGNLVRKILLLPTLPVISGFEIIPLPQEGDYIYWLNFHNKYASGGLAYIVRDGYAISFCDPLWEEEQTANYRANLDQTIANIEATAKMREENAKAAAEAEAAANAKAAAYPKTENIPNNNGTKKNPPPRKKTFIEQLNEAYPAPQQTYMQYLYQMRNDMKIRNDDANRQHRLNFYRQR